MCFTHSPNAARRWLRENRHKRYVIVWKRVDYERGRLYSNTWTRHGHRWVSGEHEKTDQLTDLSRSKEMHGEGFYVWLREPDYPMRRGTRLIRLTVRPADLVGIAGYGNLACFRRVNLTRSEYLRALGRA